MMVTLIWNVNFASDLIDYFEKVTVNALEIKNLNSTFSQKLSEILSANPPWLLLNFQNFRLILNQVKCSMKRVLKIRRYSF